jgi:phosphotransferase system HPr (HPr) family protein
MSDATSCSRRVRIVNQKGLHARPCGAIVATALRFQADLRVRCGASRLVNGKSIIDLITLEASEGAELELEAQGPDAALLVAALEALVAAGFNELS